MKKFLLFAMALIAFASCSKDDAIDNESIDGKEYVVNLGFSGEITITQTPLTKAGTNDLYGVQVYSKKSGDSDYAPFAYGLFDNTTDMEVKLIGGYQYKFVASMVEDGKNMIRNVGGNYSSPFRIGFDNTPIGNVFIYSSAKEMDDLDNGATNVQGYTYERPNVVRFYGELSNFTPAEGKSANINMKKVSFGVKFKVNDFTEGKIIIQIPEAPEMSISYPETETEDILTFRNNISSLYKDFWTDDNYQENLEVHIAWTKADGTVIPISNQIIEFTRNKLTTVTINLKEDSSNTDINMDLEDEDIQPGDEVIVNR